MNLRLSPWLRRLVTRLIAIIPAVIVTAIAGEKGAEELLVLSQVILSIQLPFAIIPLLLFTSDKKIMGEFANKMWQKVLTWIVTAIIIILNVVLIIQTISG